jgi:hypothetical protein
MLKKIRRGCIWVLPLMMRGRRKLSERLTRIAPQMPRIAALI